MYWNKKAETLKGKDLERLQKRRLLKTLEQARNVEFYRQQLKTAGIRFDDIRTLEDITNLFYSLAQAGANHVIVKFCEQVASNRKSLIERMEARKLPRVDKFDNLFTQVVGGVYTIREDIRLKWLRRLLSLSCDLGLTMSTCYEYVDDGTQGGTSIGPFFTTSDQCHGRGVPMFYRPEPGMKFQPLPGCYRKGCLYCEDYGTKCCGNSLLLQAKALKYSDYQAVRLVGDESNWDLEDSCSEPDYAVDDYIHNAMGNPGLMTDAEMWGWSLE